MVIWIMKLGCMNKENDFESKIIKKKMIVLIKQDEEWFFAKEE